MNRIYQPRMNPIKFQLINPVTIPNYVSKHMDDYEYSKTLSIHDDKSRFVQQWMTIDPVRLQMESNYGTLPIKFIRCRDGAEMISTTFTDLIQNFFNPDFYVRQLDFDLVTYPADVYYFLMDDKYISEIIETKVDQEDTVFVEYSNYEKRGGLRFDIPGNNFKPGIRIPGRVLYFDTGSDEIIYTDDIENETIIESKDFTISELHIGNTGSGAQTPGVPPWFIDKVKRICGCSDLSLDGRLYTKMKDSKWEDFKEDGTLLVGSKRMMSDRYNREAIIYDNDTEVIGVAAAGLMMDNKGFGIEDNSGNDYLEISSLQ